ncbi:MAG: type II toxin-antitoxin system RelE/ParE family toxin [Planctomycetaceae bacterium]|nr:type II toxin-antitoxin system RelE/ParE family toxin [Planctomycetaceae bacterium]
MSMSLSLYILPAAEDDLSEIGDYFDERDDALSQRFYEQFWKTVQTLVASPQLGERCRFRSPKTKGMRVWQVYGFSNYLVFYHPQGDTLQVLRVIHGARDYMTIFENDKS